MAAMNRTRQAETVTFDLDTALRVKRISRRSAAATIGKQHDYVNRRLNGTVPMTLDDLEVLAAVAGLDVRVELVPHKPASAGVSAPAGARGFPVGA